MINWLLQPFAYDFMVRGLLASLLVGVLCAVMGCYVVLRSMAFLGDALAHAILPGVAIAYLVGANLMVGALVAAVLGALLIGYFTRSGTVKEDTAIGILFAAALSLGVMLISSIRTYAVDLTHILFGNVLGVSSGDLLLTAGISLGVLAVVALLYRPFLVISFDPVLAATLLWLFAAWRGIPLLLRDGAGWPGGVAAGVLFGLEFVCVYLGLQYTTASRLVVFLYLAPFVVAVGMPFISRAERLSRAQVAGLTAAFGSVAFAFQEGFSASVPNQWLGDLLAVLAGLLWGATTLVVRATRLSTASPERTLFYQLAVSAPVLLGGALLSGESMAWPPPGWALASIAFQSVVVAFASFLGWFWMLRHYPATKVSSFTFLTPVFGLGFGALLLGEVLTPKLLLALAGVALGIWLVNRR